MKISIRAVAQAAGVSPTTVSHVLNDVPGKRVSTATRDRIREAADRLGYVPNEVARQLSRQRSWTIGLLSDEVATTPYAGQMVLGAQEAAGRHGWLLMLLNSSRDRQLEHRGIRAMLQGRVDGMLYATMYHRIVTVPEELATVPTVLLDARSAHADMPSVVPDEAGGGWMATEALLRHGHRRIAFINNRDDIPARWGRLAGYRAALEHAGIAFNPALVADAQDQGGDGYRVALEILSWPERPTALFCFNDRMALGAYQAAAALGLNIPADLSIVGFDDQADIANGLTPGLTTVALPHYEMGEWAVNTLIQRLETGQLPQPLQTTMPCPLVERHSIAAPAA